MSGKKEYAQAEFLGGLILYALIGGALIAGFQWLRKAWAGLFHDQTSSSPTTTAVHTGPSFFEMMGHWILNGLIYCAVAVLLLVIFIVVFKIWHKQLAEKDIRWIEIVPHVNTENEIKKIQAMIGGFYENKRTLWDRIWRGREVFELRFVGQSSEKEDQKDEIHIYFGYPQDKASSIPSEIKSCYPNCDLISVPLDKVPQPFLNNGVGGYLYFTDKRLAGLPLAQLKEDRLANVLQHMKKGTYLSIAFSPTRPSRFEAVLAKTQQRILRKNGRLKKIFIWILKKITRLLPIGFLQALMVRFETIGSEKSNEYIELMKKRRADNHRYFDVSIQIWQEDYREDIAQTLFNQINNTMRFYNSLHLNQIKKSPISLVPSLKKAMVWTGNELANLCHLPTGRPIKEDINEREQNEHIYDRIPHIIFGQNKIGSEFFESGATIGHYVYPGEKKRLVHLLPKKLRKHMVILGKTGSGKTALFLALLRFYFLPMFVAGDPSFSGFTFVDPKGKGAKTALTYFADLKARGIEFDESRIHYFDITGTDYILGINLFDKLPGQTDEDVVSNALHVMQSTFPNESIWFEKYGQLAIRALLRDQEETHTILSLPAFLKKESPLRNRIVFQLITSGSVADHDLGMQIIEADAEGKFGSREIEPLLNRLSRLKDNPVTQRIFGQKRTSIDPKRYMQEGHIAIINIKGLDPISSQLVMGYITMLYHQFCYDRTNTASNHYLVFDEAHRLQLPVLHESIIPEDRDAGLVLILMTQMLNQFSKELQDAITDIGGNIICFRSGAKTARAAQIITGQRFKAQDIINLDELRACVLTEDKRGKNVSFIIDTFPPYVFHKDGSTTYYGPDENRISREENQAFQDAIKQFGIPAMQRDCLHIDEVMKAIEEQIQNNWTRDFDLSQALSENKEAARFMKHLLEEKKSGKKKKETEEKIDVWGGVNDELYEDE